MLDLKLVKKHLKVDVDDVGEDDLIELYMASALTVAENYTG
ncbi:phage head-tail connector protein, partial [Myroides odoratimimus]|nr:phage head-tail connector protein [Myroides odoratimimus]